MYGYHLVLSVELLKGNESTNVETLAKFLERTQEVWRSAHMQMEKAMAMQKSYYAKKYRDLHFSAGDLVLLSTQNLRLKGIPHKLQWKFCDPYKILGRIGTRDVPRPKIPRTGKTKNVYLR